MQRAVRLGTAIGVVNAAAMLGLLRLASRRADFGWYAYRPLPSRYPNSASLGGMHSWAAVGLVAGLLIALNTLACVGYVVVRRRADAHSG
jgi:hypothetical protein